MIRNALVFRHLVCEGLGSFEAFLVNAGISVRVVDTPSEDISGLDPLATDLLIVMGGSMGVYDAPECPFLTQEIKFLEKRLAADKPTLGICLGSQLMAAALGAKVYPGAQGKEYGWHGLTFTEEGKKSPTRHFDGAQTSMFHWHGDTFDLPKGAVLLASTEKYKNQIFSFGKNALGIQCHPEVTESDLQEWFAAPDGMIEGPNATAEIDIMREETKKFAAGLLEQNEKFFTAWLEEMNDA
ncbi:MAG TPA: glutamine amidotransferase [Rhodospirillaceae bacterium]|nr:glutamine amidotransferase [Rhodospirillaceae bacterium]